MYSFLISPKSISSSSPNSDTTPSANCNGDSLKSETSLVLLVLRLLRLLPSCRLRISARIKLTGSCAAMSDGLSVPCLCNISLRIKSTPRFGVIGAADGMLGFTGKEPSTGN